jgi:DNA polymerase (family 10)
MALLLEVEGANRYRARAYERAARAVEALGDSLDVLIAEGGLTRVPGIGPALAATIAELAGTGRSASLERLRQRLPPGGLGEKTERRLKAAIERRAGSRREAMLLHEATAETDAILAAVRALPTVERAEVAGALRRRVESVARLDIVVAGRDVAAIVDSLARLPRAASTLERNADRLVLRLTSGMVLQAVVVPPASYPVELHRLTGSPAHLAQLDARARERGLTLDSDGLRRGARRVPVRGERDIYRHLGLPYLIPEVREGEGEIEAAAGGSVPGEPLELGDLRGMVHCHTTYSDGAHSIEEMARGADALGLEYLTITDHSPAAAYARGLTVDRLRRQWDEIARVQEKVRVRLLRGTESDILADGSLDYPDDVLAELDVVIASIHHRHRMDAAQMTRRLVTAMRHPRFKIWGHALGRYVLRRPPFACHVEEVLDALARSRGAVEVNGDPHRLDMEPRWIREARRRGIAFVVSSDAHSVAALANLRWGVDMARRGWLARRDVLNALGPDEFRAAVRP